VDGFGERLETVLRPLSGLLAGVPGLLGSALLGDGTVMLVLDLPGLIR
jgi:two-component system chemotaxis sensor kinase CheA